MNTNNLIKTNYFNSSECLLNNQQQQQQQQMNSPVSTTTSQINNNQLKQNPIFYSQLKQNNNNNNRCHKSAFQTLKQDNDLNNISSSMSLSSGYGSGSNSMSLSSSSTYNAMSKQQQQPQQQHQQQQNFLKNEIKSGSVSSTKSIYELKLINSNNIHPSNSVSNRLNHSAIISASQSKPNLPIKTRLTSFQPTNNQQQQRSSLYLNNQQNPLILSANKRLLLNGPILASSRHSSTNSTKINNNIITPRNSTSTSNNNNSNRANISLNDSLNQQSLNNHYRRFSHNYVIDVNPHPVPIKTKSILRNSNNYIDVDDEDDDGIPGGIDNDDLSYDENEDIFTDNDDEEDDVDETDSRNVKKETSYLVNMTPDTSASTTSSSSMSCGSNNINTNPVIINASLSAIPTQTNQTYFFSKSDLKKPSTMSPVNLNSTGSNIGAAVSLTGSSIALANLGTPDIIKYNQQSYRQYKLNPQSANGSVVFSCSSSSASSTSSASLTPPPLPSTTQSFVLSNLLNANQTNNKSFYTTISPSLANFSHFDVQSIFFNYNYIKSIVNCLHMSINIKTGASAASRQSSIENLNKTLPIQQQPQTPLTDSARSESDLQLKRANRLSSSVTVYLSDSATRSPAALSTKSTVSSPEFILPKQRSSTDEPLVEECQCFRVEVGGDVFKGLGIVEEVSQRRMMKLNSISIIDKINSNYKKEIIDLIEANNNEPFTIEYQDWGSFYYRYYFSSQDHSNYLGIDRDIGPIAISIRRDKIQIETPKRPLNIPQTVNGNTNNEKTYDYAYRFILRTSDLNTLRGTILEEHIVSKYSPTSKGLPHKEIINFLLPELDLNCLRLADSKIHDKLVDLDEQYIIKNHKIGVLLCKAGQSTEEEMYNNKESTPAFEEFLQVLGEKVCLKGFYNYRGGLDNTSDTTGTHSVYTKFRNKELMFHVSTLLPYSNNDKQQLTRKRHIGNDLVTIIFQEAGSLPFSPKSIRSQYQHIFIIVRAVNSNPYNPQYSVAVSYSKDIPAFGPPLPKQPLFLKSKEFRDFLLAKLVNADNVGLRCEKFTQIRMRTRHGALKDLVDSYSTKLTLENCAYGGSSNGVVQKLGLFNFGSIKQKKMRSKSLHLFNTSQLNEEATAISLSKLSGAIFWNIELVEDFQYSLKNYCYLGISKQYIVVIDAIQKCVIFSIGCNAVIGWTLNESEYSFVLYFDQGEFINVKLKNRLDLNSVIRRLEFFTRGCKTIELSLEKKDYGQLGFNIHHDGVVTEVEQYSIAHYRGLKQGTRIVKIADNYVSCLSHEKMIDLLRRATCLKVTFLPPLEDGSARRGCDDSFSLYAYLSTCSSLNERQIDSATIKTVTPNLNRATIKNTPKAQQPSLPCSPRRVRNNSNNIAKLINRLSTSGSVLENPNAFSNSLYLGYDHLGQNDKSGSTMTVNSSDKYKENLPQTPVSRNVGKLLMQSANWPKNVQTASKVFESVHRDSDAYNDTGFVKQKLNSTNTSIGNRIQKKIHSNERLNSECIDKNCYEKLMEDLRKTQLELDRKKLENSILVKKEESMEKEVKNLKQIIRCQDELINKGRKVSYNIQKNEKAPEEANYENFPCNKFTNQIYHETVSPAPLSPLLTPNSYKLKKNTNNFFPPSSISKD